eukprot:1662979-Amphidinium_carterae.1
MPRAKESQPGSSQGSGRHEVHLFNINISAPVLIAHKNTGLTSVQKCSYHKQLALAHHKVGCSSSGSYGPMAATPCDLTVVAHQQSGSDPCAGSLSLCRLHSERQADGRSFCTLQGSWAQHER